MKNLDFEWLTDEFMLYCRNDIIGRSGVVFIGVFQKVLQHKIGLQLLIFLLALSGNDLSFQEAVSLTGNLFIFWFLLHSGSPFESAF